MNKQKPVVEAAQRLQAADVSDANGVDMFKAASGGYGRDKQQQLLNDIRTVYAAILGGKPGSGPAHNLFTVYSDLGGFDAA